MHRIANTRFARLVLLLLVFLLGRSVTLAQATGFTYQGRLTDGGSPANGAYDLQFRLYDALTGGTQIGATAAFEDVAVSDGSFTFIGSNSNGAAGITNATSIGAGTQVTQSNSLVLGSGANVGIGISAPLAKLDIRGDVFVGLIDPPDIVTTPGNNLYIANDGGDANNSFRLDGYLNTLYISTRSGAGSNAGTQIRFRTGTAREGDPDRVIISEKGNHSTTGPNRAGEESDETAAD